MKAIITLITIILAFVLYTSGQETSRDSSTDLLKIVIEGGAEGFVDETYVHFHEDATTGYDIEIDAKKWFSLDPEATMIWTVASDATDLAINNLPLNELHSNLNTIPLQFVCGYGGGEYTMTFSKLETFDESVEIWIEDLLLNEGWIQISSENTTYTFNGIPDEAEDRFKIHIQDNTTITGFDEKDSNEELVKIYSSGNKIFINKHTDINMKNIRIVNMSGQAVKYDILTNTFNLNTFRMDGPTGYYIIQVIVNNLIYSEKVFINNQIHN